jgi:hypothetical protein
VLSSNADPQAALSSAVSVVSPSSTAAAARTIAPRSPAAQSSIGGERPRYGGDRIFVPMN